MSVSAKILIVDDEPFNVDVLEQTLEDYGYETCSANSGKEALEALEQCAPDLVLLDWMMPEMNGIEVLRHMRVQEKYQTLPVILLTARDSAEDKVEALDAGASDYITKPPDESELMARVRSALRVVELERQLERERDDLLRALKELQETREQLTEDMRQELETAHRLQMALMPSEAPQLPGFDIAGRCISANHVGGDFFQYFELSRKRLALALADVTGHAMAAAIPVVMFSGILESQMELSGLVSFDEMFEFDIELRGSLEELLERLNRSLHRMLDQRTFVCFVIGEIDPATQILRLANSGCPYPLRYFANQGIVRELEVSNYPLGVRTNTSYETIEVKLAAGDYVVFCSDGIVEAANGQEEFFGFERTAETVRVGCSEGLSAEELIERLIDTVQAFVGDEPQGDDMTCMVLKVEA